MHVRMMPKQEPPYTRLIDSARRQPEETAENIKGTIIDSIRQNYSMVLVLQVSISILQMMTAIWVDMY